MRRQEIEQDIDWKQNSFTLLRYIAAFEVLIGHCVTHFAINTDSILFRLYAYTVGRFHGVPVFFGLSGFLIWASLSSRTTLSVYLKKRFIRIYPELWLAVILSIVSILLLYKQYFPISLGVFAITQSTFLQFWTPDSLRGFGCGTPNGSLWTIFMFVQFYLIAWMLHKWLHKTHHECYKNVTGGGVLAKWILLFCLSFFFTIGYKQASVLFSSGVENIYYKLLGQTVLPYLFMFFSGMICFEFKTVILPILKKYWWLIIMLYYTISISGFDIPATYINLLSGILLVLMTIALGFRFIKPVIKTDISYGIYLFHMVVVNVLLETGSQSKIVNAMLALIVSILLAFISKAITDIIARYITTPLKH
ncbi:MAG: acyltransferase [Acinetobacter sp.]